jgi:aryl-alcohol dehydrogenase-like predicted oxidoreductase
MKDDSTSKISRATRREFLGAGGAIVLGGAIPFQSYGEEKSKRDEKEEQARIKQFRTLGRTGFEVSDISMGGTRNRDSNVVRYAYDCGVNYFDTGESYGGGESEKLIGEAMKFMDRKRIFITTKIHIGEGDNEETVLDRFRKCQERLKVDYIDAFFLHGVSDAAVLDHAGFHSATDRLKAEGRLRFIGLSSHGARWGRGASMEDVLCAAAEDGRFDLMLLIYSFMNREAGEKVLAACKKKNIGTTAMKTTPGVLKVEPFDPENPTERQAQMIERYRKRGMTEERIAERMQRGVERQKEAKEKTESFAKKYRIKTDDQLRRVSIRWVLKNPDMHTVCVSFSDFDLIDKVVPLSGTKLSRADSLFLDEYRQAFDDQYCRHGCSACIARCPRRVPVSTVMRYAYYFECQHREKDAIGKYALLKGRDASRCAACDAPCSGSCPYGVDVRGQMLRAHSLLTLV